MKKIRSYKDLIVWQKSMLLVEKLYLLTKTFPKEETFNLISQIRRCAVSIPSNIAEGKGRGTKKDYRQFLLISYGSASELETQIIIAYKLGYLNEKEYQEIAKSIDEISRILMTIIRKLNEK